MTNSFPFKDCSPKTLNYFLTVWIFKDFCNPQCWKIWSLCIDSDCHGDEAIPPSPRTAGESESGSHRPYCWRCWRKKKGHRKAWALQMQFPPMDFACPVKFEDVRNQHFLEDAKVVEVGLMLQTNKLLFELFCCLTSDTGTDVWISQLLFNGVLTSKTSFTYLKDYKLVDACFAQSGPACCNHCRY